MPILPLPVNDNFFKPGDTLQGGWKIVNLMEKGGFGQIYLVESNKQENLKAVVKAEDAKKGSSSLPIDVYVLNLLQTAMKVTTKTHTLNCMVMSLCGSNLAQLRRKMASGHFSLGTSLMLSLQILLALEDIHKVNFIHRDVKPSNFAMGLGTRSRVVIMLDFGLAKEYRDSKTGKVKEPRKDAGFRGTLRYASITTHEFQEMSQVDDLWSMFYMMIEFLNGAPGLPWAYDLDREAVLLKKRSNPPDVLLQKNPPKLFEFPKHLFTLRYGESPDYKILQTVLSMVLADGKVDPDTPFDWEKPKKDVEPKTDKTGQDKLSFTKSQINRARGTHVTTRCEFDFQEGNFQMMEMDHDRKSAGSSPATSRCTPVGQRTAKNSVISWNDGCKTTDCGNKRSPSNEKEKGKSTT